MSLEGRAALVTGGAGHIGLAICETIVEMGARVAVLDIDPVKCENVTRKLNGLRESMAVPVPVDLRDEQMTRRAVDEVVRRLRRIDVLVHAAAFVGTSQVSGWTVPFERQTVAAWDTAVRVNLTAGFILAQEAYPTLLKSDSASVIFIGSIYGLVGPDPRLYAETEMVSPAGYAASKGGLIQLTRYLATLFAPNVRVNAISPGGVWRDQPEPFFNRYVERTPLGRMATEEDIKGAVAFLASDLSTYVTGHNLVVDGGWTLW